MPVWIGTNIHDKNVKDCMTQHGDQYSQKANLQTSWYLGMICMSIRQRELRWNKDRLAIFRSDESTIIIIGTNRSVNIRG